jgi:hypothetical protein
LVSERNVAGNSLTSREPNALMLFESAQAPVWEQAEIINAIRIIS